MESSYEKRGYLLEDFRLFHLRDADGIRTDYHYHEFCKLLILLSGSGSYMVEGRRYLLKPGDMVLLGSHCIHRPEFAPGVPYERIILYISPEFLRRESAGSCRLENCFSSTNGHVLRLGETHRKTLLNHVEALEQELSQTHYGREIACNSLLLQLLVGIARCRQQTHIQQPAPARPDDPTVTAIVAYLDSHLTESLTIDDLAERFYLSKFHMMRRFREQTGATIHSYLNERRLFLARELLAQGVPSTEVCYQVGFGSYSAFARTFSKLFGTTPTGRPIQSMQKEEAFE